MWDFLREVGRCARSHLVLQLAVPLATRRAPDRDLVVRLPGPPSRSQLASQGRAAYVGMTLRPAKTCLGLSPYRIREKGGGVL